jgi:hypothetical protein
VSDKLKKYFVVCIIYNNVGWQQQQNNNIVSQSATQKPKYLCWLYALIIMYIYTYLGNTIILLFLISGQRQQPLSIDFLRGFTKERFLVDDNE